MNFFLDPCMYDSIIQPVQQLHVIINEDDLSSYKNGENFG